MEVLAGSWSVTCLMDVLNRDYDKELLCEEPREFTVQRRHTSIRQCHGSSPHHHAEKKRERERERVENRGGV